MLRQHFSTDYTASLLEVNMQKNRYTNILAREWSTVPHLLRSSAEKTRVKLSPIADQEGSDYINANYINGLAPNTERAYIATQGPLPNTYPGEGY